MAFWHRQRLEFPARLLHLLVQFRQLAGRKVGHRAEQSDRFLGQGLIAPMPTCEPSAQAQKELGVPLGQDGVAGGMPAAVPVLGDAVLKRLKRRLIRKADPSRRNDLFREDVPIACRRHFVGEVPQFLVQPDDLILGQELPEQPQRGPEAAQRHAHLVDAFGILGPQHTSLVRQHMVQAVLNRVNQGIFHGCVVGQVELVGLAACRPVA